MERQPDLPGTRRRPSRFRPQFHYELIVCGLRGHELVGMDAAQVRPQDAPFVREADGLRWYRCLRCDSWLPLQPPPRPAAEFPPERDDVELPLRGKALRDKIVLRLIAIDRAFHFVVLAALSLVINIAVVVYLLYAKRLFGLRGGAAAEHEERQRDSGWEALERATPGLDVPLPSQAPVG